MRMTTTKPLTLKTQNGPKIFHPGDVFEADPEKARPHIEAGLLRPVDSIEELDRFFSAEIIPRLAKLHTAGRLPDPSTCPLWAEVDRLWGRPDPDAEKVKAAMTRALEAYERGLHEKERRLFE